MPEQIWLSAHLGAVTVLLKLLILLQQIRAELHWIQPIQV